MGTEPETWRTLLVVAVNGTRTNMIRGALAWLRERIAVEDADERIEGSGEPIMSPQHRRSSDAEGELGRLEALADETERGDS